MTEIISAAERTTLAEPEARLSLSELHTLLREAAAYERAQRPIVLHGPETAVTVPHAGIDVSVPAASVTVATVKRSERSIWPLLWMTSACVGVGSCLVTAVTGSLIPLAVTRAALAVWGVATYQLVFVREL